MSKDHEDDCGEPECIGCSGATTEQIRDVIEGDIARVGWSLMGIGAGEDFPTFLYTVGLKDYSLPDIIVVGLPPQWIGGFINEFIESLVEGKKLEMGKTYEDVLNGFPVRVGAVSEEWKEELMTATGARHRDGFEAIQLIWADKNNNFPGDKDYDIPAERQPLLA